MRVMTREEAKHDLTRGPTSETSPQAGHSRATVLVVDDDPRILRFIRTSLRLAGYEVVTVQGGGEALALVDSSKPDILVLDIVMSPMDGLEVLKRLRLTSQLPVIIMSAHSSAAQQALSLGADAFLGKPFTPDQLVSEIESVLGKRK